MFTQMKTTLIISICILITICATARIIERFHGWDITINDSQYIAIVHCKNPTPPKPNVRVMDATKSDSEIEIVFTLKGTNSVNPSRLLTDYELRPRENYLVFGYCNEGVYCAYEEYRIVPLGNFSSTNLLVGEPLDEQLHILFKRRLDDLNRRIKEEQDEKARLEESLKK